MNQNVQERFFLIQFFLYGELDFLVDVVKCTHDLLGTMPRISTKPSRMSADYILVVNSLQRLHEQAGHDCAEGGANGKTTNLLIFFPSKLEVAEVHG